MDARPRISSHASAYRRRSFALLTTILLIALLVAVTGQLVTVTSTEAVSASRRHRSLAHELAVDSALLVLADRLRNGGERPSDLIRELDQLGVAQAAFEIGPVTVRCTIRDDAAKLNPLMFQRPDQQPKLVRRLTALGVYRSLPPAKVSLKPVVTTSSSWTGAVYHWYDQILTDIEPGMVFQWNEDPGGSYSAPVWSDAVTFWGDGRIDLRRVDANVLETALQDIRPGLAGLLLAARPADRSVNFLQTALTRVHAEIRQQVATRLTYNGRRYAVRINTTVNADTRRWYIVARIEDGKALVLHRSQLRW